MNWIDPSGYRGCPGQQCNSRQSACSANNIQACTAGELAWLLDTYFSRFTGGNKAVTTDLLRRLGQSKTGNILLNEVYNKHTTDYDNNFLWPLNDLTILLMEQNALTGAGGAATWDGYLTGRHTIVLNKTVLISRLCEAEAGTSPHPALQSKNTVLNYTAAILGHEFFHIAIGDSPWRKNIGDPTGLAYRVEAKIVNELFYGGDSRNYSDLNSVLRRHDDAANNDPRYWTYEELDPSNTQATLALSGVSLEIPFEIAVDLISVPGR